MSSNKDSGSIPGSDRHWWLTEGPEFCFVCETSVHPEVLAYCAGCDQGLCSVCLWDNTGHGESLCPQCAAELKEST